MDLRGRECVEDLSHLIVIFNGMDSYKKILNCDSNCVISRMPRYMQMINLTKRTYVAADDVSVLCEMRKIIT